MLKKKKKFRTGLDAYGEMVDDQLDAFRYMAESIKATAMKNSPNGLTKAKFKALVKKGRKLMKDEKKS